MNNCTNTGETTTIQIGFRKDGVDGNNFIESRCDGDWKQLSRYYFALYEVTIKPDPDYKGYFKVIATEYAV